MAHERHDRTSLPSELRYRVVGTGPRAEAQHGRYIRSILRYLEAHKPTQWLIATEAISRPHAPSDDGQNARTPRTGGDGPPHSDSSGESGNTSDTSDTTDTGRDEPDQLESLRARLFGAGDNYDATENGTRGRTPIPTGEANTALVPVTEQRTPRMPLPRTRKHPPRTKFNKTGTPAITTAEPHRR